jgi:hypothetical protein
VSEGITDPVEIEINKLKLAEHQFRLAATVHLAVVNGVQTLDVPIEWTFGRHCTTYDEFGLRPDQADVAASMLEYTASLALASAVRNALKVAFGDPRKSTEKNVEACWQFSRMLRNAFSHDMVAPRWSIDDDCRERDFQIGDVMVWRTHGLNGQLLRWQHYGGPIALFKFLRFVRTQLLNDPVDPDRKLPDKPRLECYQQGRLVARRIA